MSLIWPCIPFRRAWVNAKVANVERGSPCDAGPYVRHVLPLPPCSLLHGAFAVLTSPGKDTAVSTNWGSSVFVGVLVIRALLFGVYMPP